MAADLRRTLLGCIFLSLSAVISMGEAAAYDSTVSWTIATVRIDGSPLAPSEVKETRVYYQLCTAGSPDTTSPFQVAAGAVTTMVIPVTSGEWCYKASHVDMFDQESALSSEARLTVPTASQQPQGLTVTGLLTAYVLQQSLNAVTLLAVGTVPTGTPCDTRFSVNGKYAVPRSAVTWFGSVQPEVVFADCG